MTDLLRDQVLIAVRSIARALDFHYKHLKRVCGLTGPQLIVLKAIAGGREMPTGELAQAVRLTNATVTDIVDRLERRGYVSRKSGDIDRRNVLVSITPSGASVLKKSPPLLHEGFVSEFSKLPEWEQTSMVSVLQRVATMIGAERSDREPLLSIAPLGGNTRAKGRLKRVKASN